MNRLPGVDGAVVAEALARCRAGDAGWEGVLATLDLPAEIVAHVDAGDGPRPVSADVVGLSGGLDDAGVTFDAPSGGEGGDVLDLLVDREGLVVATLLRSVGPGAYATRVRSIGPHYAKTGHRDGVNELVAAAVALDLAHEALRPGAGAPPEVRIDADKSVVDGELIAARSQERLAAFRWRGVGLDELVAGLPS